MPSTPARPPLRVLWRESHATSAVLAALAASIPAAGVTAAFMALGDSLLGRPATTLLDVMGGPWALLAGSALFATLWAVLVAFTAHHLAPAAGALWGALYGVGVWLVLYFLILPWVNPELAAATPARVGVLVHAAWGAALGALFHPVRVTERRRHLRRRR